MSSYSCVVPVEWERLWGDLVPAWLSLLAGEIEPAQFRARYLPAGVQPEGLIDPHERYHASPEYLALFARHALSPPYTAQDVRAGLGRGDSAQQRLPNNDEYLLLDAISQSVVVDLPGEDRFAGTAFSIWEEHWGSRQVAGTKNFFHFLRCAYELTWERERQYYACARRPDAASPRLFELFEALLLFQRVLPGAIVARCPPSWPAHDSLRLGGYLDPDEVRQLAAELDAWNAPEAVQDEWFWMFVDRVRRSAEADCGLLTLHAAM